MTRFVRNVASLAMFLSFFLPEGADARRIRETGVRVTQIRGFPDSIPAVEVYRRLGLDKESRAAQCLPRNP